MAFGRDGSSAVAEGTDTLSAIDLPGPISPPDAAWEAAAAALCGPLAGPWAGGWIYDSLGSYAWLFIGSFGIGLGAVAIAFAFRPPAPFRIAVPSVAH